MVDRHTNLERTVSDLIAANELAVEHSDAEMSDEVSAGIEGLRTELEKLETEALFSGELDDHDVVMSIHPGAGGTDAQDWAEMLLRMFLRWAERDGFDAAVREALAGDEAGTKSATIEMRGPHAYGWLQSEHGVHRLVRLSPFDSAHRRHTSFASVDVIPDLGDEVEIEHRSRRSSDRDLPRAGGRRAAREHDRLGRAYHAPADRDRGDVSVGALADAEPRGRDEAAASSRLAERQRREREEELAELRGEQRAIDFGSQIRSYVQHPYQMVKDHRTDHETSSVDKVLDGDLDDFMTAYLRWLRAGAEVVDTE